VGSTVLSVILNGRTSAALAHIHAPTPHLRDAQASIQGFHDVYLVAAVICVAGCLAALLLRRGAPLDEGAPKPADVRPVPEARPVTEGRMP
jgi:hypothetical protein